MIIQEENYDNLSCFRMEMVLFDILNLPKHDEDDSIFGFLCCSGRFMTSKRRSMARDLLFFISLFANFTQCGFLITIIWNQSSINCRNLSIVPGEKKCKFRNFIQLSTILKCKHGIHRGKSFTLNQYKHFSNTSLRSFVV